MTASVVIVTHRGIDDVIRRCLASIDAATTAPGLVVVVDNGSGPQCDATAYGSRVDDVVRTPNRGFGAAANVGVRRCLDRCPEAYVVVLNDDVEVDPDWLTPLLESMDDDRSLGAVQPLLLSADGRVGSAGVRLDRHGAGSDIGRGRAVRELGPVGAIDIFTGGAVMMRSEFIEQTAGFDERYFLYYEDVDLALRGAELGWRYRCVTASTVRHRGGATTDALGADRIRLQERNRLWIAARFLPPRTFGRALWLSLRRLRHSPHGAHARALFAGLGGMPGAWVRRWSAPAMPTD